VKCDCTVCCTDKRAICVLLCICVYQLYTVHTEEVLIVRYTFYCFEMWKCVPQRVHSERRLFAFHNSHMSLQIHCPLNLRIPYDHSNHVPLFIKLTCRFCNCSCTMSIMTSICSYFLWNSANSATISCCKHKTNFRKRVPFTAQYYNLNNYPPEPSPRVYYSPAVQNPMSTVLTVLFSMLQVRCVA
jgi:hypothetical protein